MKKTLLSLALLTMLSACATAIDGNEQTVTVETNPPGARCELKNENGSWIVDPTPGSATVKGASGALGIACAGAKDAGKKTAKKIQGHASLESATKAVAWGNVLAGGLIGAAVDMSSGAAYRYPASVNVNLSE